MGKDKRLLLKSEIKFSPVCGFLEVSPSPLFSAFSSALVWLSDIKVNYLGDVISLLLA